MVKKKRLKKHYLYGGLLSLVILTITPAIMHYLEIQRGYRAYGGEVIMWILPLLVAFFIDGAKD